MKQPTINAGATTTGQNVQPEPVKLLKRIGSTTYTVSVHFSQTSKESMNDKIMRLIRGDVASGKAANQ